MIASNSRKFVLSAEGAVELREAGFESSETVANAQVFTLKQDEQEFVTPNSDVDRLILIASGQIEVNVRSTGNDRPIECTEHSLRIGGTSLLSIAAKDTTATFSILELKNG